jgi:predicted DNA-binding transcriptional regulator AlpA
MPDAAIECRLLDSAEAAAFLNISRVTLERWRRNGQGPPSIRLGTTRLIRYDPEALAAYARRLETPNSLLSPDGGGDGGG